MLHTVVWARGQNRLYNNNNNNDKRKKRNSSHYQDEEIEAIVIAHPYDWDKGNKKRYFEGKENINFALRLLDFEFNDGYGSEEGFNVYAWTKTKVIFKLEYDGSERYAYLPRNPVNIFPHSVGILI